MAAILFQDAQAKYRMEATVDKVRCVVERITYQNPENGYSVLKCRIKDYSDLVPAVGNLLDANVDSVLMAEGNLSGNV